MTVKSNGNQKIVKNRNNSNTLLLEIHEKLYNNATKYPKKIKIASTERC